MRLSLLVQIARAGLAVDVRSTVRIIVRAEIPYLMPVPSLPPFSLSEVVPPHGFTHSRHRSLHHHGNASLKKDASAPFSTHATLRIGSLTPPRRGRNGRDPAILSSIATWHGLWGYSGIPRPYQHSPSLSNHSLLVYLRYQSFCP